MLMTGGVPLKHRWIATILLTAMLLTLTACSLPQDLPGGMATLTGRVTSKDERLLTVEVLEDNLHYDAGTIILVKYRALTGATSLSVGEAISVTYSYLENVTVQDKLSCISHPMDSPSHNPGELRLVWPMFLQKFGFGTTFRLDRKPFPHYNKWAIGVWRSLVSRLVRVQEAAGSNPATPTRETD